MDQIKEVYWSTALLESFAALEHEQWAHWMRHLETKMEWREGIGWVIPEEIVIRWQRQINTAYEALSEEEKESDRMWAKRALGILG